MRARELALVLMMSTTAASALAGQRGPAILTLAQAVDEALTRNDRVADQRDVVEQADLGSRLARDGFRPKVVPNLAGSFGQTNVSSQLYRVDVTQRFMTGTQLQLGLGTATAEIPAAFGTA